MRPSDTPENKRWADVIPNSPIGDVSFRLGDELDEAVRVHRAPGKDTWTLEIFGPGDSVIVAAEVFEGVGDAQLGYDFDRRHLTWLNADGTPAWTEGDGG